MGLTRPRAHQLQDSDFKQSVRAISTSNVTLSGGAPSTVDGVSLVLNDRVLVTGQSTGSQNGIYRVTTVGSGSNGTWARSPDADSTGDMTAGMVVMVTEGTSYADTSWKITTDDPITLDTTSIVFEQSSAYGYGTIAVGGQSSIVADSVGDTLTVTAGNNISLTTNAGTDTLTVAVSDTITATGNITGGNLIATGGLSLGGTDVTATAAELNFTDGMFDNTTANAVPSINASNNGFVDSGMIYNSATTSLGIGVASAADIEARLHIVGTGTPNTGETMFKVNNANDHDRIEFIDEGISSDMPSALRNIGATLGLGIISESGAVKLFSGGNTTSDIAIEASSAGVQFSGAYRFPTADGSANQFLQTDGAGTVTFASATVSDISDLTATATELNYVDGVTSSIQTQLDSKGTGTVSSLSDLSVTATAAELNKLDGATASTTELNYVTGVTSSIQTQLNSKGTGTVTSVSGGTGLSGTVTTSGSLSIDSTVATLTGTQTLTNKTLTSPVISTISNTGTLTLPTTTGTVALTSDIPTAVSELSNDSGFTTNTGTVTSVATGTGLTGGTITTSGTLSLATAGAGAATYSSGISAITVDAYGRVTSVTGSGGYTTNTGDITQVNITAGTGLSGTVNTTSGAHTQTLSIDSTVATLTGSQTLTNKTLTAPTFTGSASGADLTLSGNLTVNGTTTTVASTNTVISDNLIELNNGVASNANDSGVVIERGSTGDNAFMGWDESADSFVFGTTTATGASTGDLTITAGAVSVGSLTASGNITGGNIVTSGSAGNITGADAISSVTVNASGNITGGNLLTGGSLVLSGTAVTATATEINLLDGVTGTLVTEAGTQTLTNKTLTAPVISSISNTGTLTLPTTTGTVALTSDIPTAVSELSNDSGFTTNTGTVTSVGGTGTVNGLTLSGTVTSSGSLTLGGTLGSITVSQLAASAVTTSGESFADNDTTLMTSAAIDDRILSYGYTTNTGDITGVTAGVGLSGGGASGAVSLAVDLSELTDMTDAMVGTDEFIVLDAGADRRKAASEIGLSIFNNDSGFSTTTGTVTSVATGTGLTGGTITSSGTISIDSTVATLTGSQTLTNKTLTSPVVGTDIRLNAQAELEFYDSDSSNYVSFRAPATITSDTTWTLPASDGTADQVLATDGAGTLSWADPGSGGGSGSSYPNSTFQTIPGTNGNFDLSYNVAQTSQETAFEAGGTDAFGVNLGSVFSLMDPVGSIETAAETGLDLGVLT